MCACSHACRSSPFLHTHDALCMDMCLDTRVPVHWRVRGALCIDMCAGVCRHVYSHVRTRCAARQNVDNAPPWHSLGSEVVTVRRLSVILRGRSINNNRTRSRSQRTTPRHCTSLPTSWPSLIYCRMRTRTHAYTHVYTHGHTHACTQSIVHACINTCPCAAHRVRMSKDGSMRRASCAWRTGELLHAC